MKRFKNLTKGKLYFLGWFIPFSAYFLMFMGYDAIFHTTPPDAVLYFIISPIFVSMFFFFVWIIYLFRLLYRKIYIISRKKHLAPSTVIVSSDSSNPTESKWRHQRYIYNQKSSYSLSNQNVSWIYVTLAILFFAPYGLFLFITKTAHEKTQYFENGIKSIIFGLALSVTTATVFFLVFFPEDSINILTFVLGAIFVLGIFFIVYGLVLRHKGIVFEKLMILITMKNVTQVDRIALASYMTYAKTIKEINKLIESEILSGAYINYRDKEIIVPGISKKSAFLCKSCGGTTVLYTNEERICDYCGAEL